MGDARGGELDLHARVQIERLLHHLVRRKGDGDHRDCAQVVDGHAPVQTANDAAFAVDDGQRLDHAGAV